MLEKIITRISFADSKVNSRYSEVVNDLTTSKQVKDLLNQLEEINADEKFLSITNNKEEKISVEEINATLQEINKLKILRDELDKNEEITHKQYKEMFEDYSKQIAEKYSSLSVLNEDVLMYEFTHEAILENRSAVNTMFTNHISLKTTLKLRIK